MHDLHEGTPVTVKVSLAINLCGAYMLDFFRRTSIVITAKIHEHKVFIDIFEHL
jgi:ribosomal protein L5